MERDSAILTIKDEVTTGAKVTLKVAKPVLEAVAPIVGRSLVRKYGEFHRKKFASIKNH